MGATAFWREQQEKADFTTPSGIAYLDVIYQSGSLFYSCDDLFICAFDGARQIIRGLYELIFFFDRGYGLIRFIKGCFCVSCISQIVTHSLSNAEYYLCKVNQMVYLWKKKTL